jgi:hypothetical protein
LNIESFASFQFKFTNYDIGHIQKDRESEKDGAVALGELGWKKSFTFCCGFIFGSTIYILSAYCVRIDRFTCRRFLFQETEVDEMVPQKSNETPRFRRLLL